MWLLYLKVFYDLDNPWMLLLVNLVFQDFQTAAPWWSHVGNVKIKDQKMSREVFCLWLGH